MTRGRLPKASLRGHLTGWVKSAQWGGGTVSDLKVSRWPWQWTYAIVLERRWEQIQELAALDPEGDGVPKEYWHDQERVDRWVDDQEQKRKDKQEGLG